MDRTLNSAYFKQTVQRNNFRTAACYFDPSEIDQAANRGAYTNTLRSYAPGSISASLCPPTLAAYDRRIWQRQNVRDHLEMAPRSASAPGPHHRYSQRALYPVVKPVPEEWVASSRVPDERVLRHLQYVGNPPGSKMEPTDTTVHQLAIQPRTTSYFSSYCKQHL